MPMEILSKEDIGTTADLVGRLYQIGPLQQVSTAIGFKCKRCGHDYPNKPRACSNDNGNGDKCKSEEFLRRAYRGTLEDQRYIEINLINTKVVGENSFNDLSTFLIDLRGKPALEFDYEFGDVLKINGTLEYAESISRQPNKEMDTFFMFMKGKEITKMSEELVKK